jgi:hypothetical protein
MKIIEINALPNGAHRNQMINRKVKLPDGYALIPEGMVLENFPFGTLTAEEIDGVMTVTSWMPGAIPERKASEKELAELEIKQLKAKLDATDYQAIKYAEGELSEVEYEPTRVIRREWRARINELEARYELGGDTK